MEAELTTTAWLGGYSPQYDVDRLADSAGGTHGIARLFRADRNVAFALAARHALPRDARPHWPNELAFLERSPVTTVWLNKANRLRKRRLHPRQLAVISVAPEDSALTFRLLVADGDPDARGATTLVGWSIIEGPWGYGPDMAEEIRQSAPLPPETSWGWDRPGAEGALEAAVSARRRVVTAQQELDAAVASERATFSVAVNEQGVSMYAIQEATAAAGVRISQQGVRGLLSKPTPGDSDANKTA